MLRNLVKEIDMEPLPPFLAPLREHDRNLSIVIVVSLLLTIFGAFNLLLAPPTDADAYEYAGLARTYLETGRLEHEMLPSPGYLSTNRNVPQPAADRVTLWTALMIPVQALLGDSVWVFLLPGLLSFFFLGPLAYLFAVALFDKRAAFFAALAVMLLPRIVYIAFVEDAGQPNFLFFDLMLVTLSMALRHRWLSVGLFAGLMTATRLTGMVAVVAVLLWVCLSERDQLRRSRFWLFLLLTATVVAPFFIARASALSEFGLGSLPQSSILTADPDMMEHVHQVGTLTHLEYNRKPSPPADNTTPVWRRRAKLIARNVGIITLFGFNSKISSYPGLAGIITFSLLPFAILGFIRGLWDRRIRLMLLIILVGVAVFSLRIAYEDRYLFPQAAMAAMLAFFGADTCAKRWRLISPGRLFLVFLLLEAGPNLAMNTMRLAGSSARHDFAELAEISHWVRRNTPPDATLLTVPFWSPHYLMHRKTALLPLGDQHDFRDAAQQYRADYMLFEWFWPGDRLPRLPYLTPLVRGQRFILYHIDRGHPAFADPDATIPHLVDFDWFGYFWNDRFTIQTNTPLFKAIAYFAHSLAIGWALFIAVWLAVLLGPAWLHRLPWVIFLILLPLLVTVVQVRLMIGQFVLLQANPPHFCLTQAKRFIDSAPPSEAVRKIRLVLKNPATLTAWEYDWRMVGVPVSVEPYFHGKPPTPGEAVFVEVADAAPPVGRAWYAGKAFEAERQHGRHLQTIAFGLKQAGYRVEILDAGVIGIPVVPPPQ
ncbi:MAG TPA: glycosyltransferase family 39 protein [bacterium]|nr:glycosyltransferase family 39 protein [bacterium]